MCAFGIAPWQLPFLFKPRDCALRPTRKARYLRLAGPLCICLAVLGMLAGLRHYQRQMLAEYWLDRIKASAESDVDEHLRSALALGESGLTVVVRSLGSERETVVAAARYTLFEEMARWELLPDEEADDNVDRLAALLNQYASRFGEQGRLAAAETAVRILHWSGDSSVGPSNRLAACQHVLELAAPSKASSRVAAATEPAGEPVLPVDRSVLPSRPAAVEREHLLTAFEHASPLPGGGLPIDLHLAAAEPGSNAEPDQKGSATMKPGLPPPELLPEVLDARPLVAEQVDQRLPSEEVDEATSTPAVALVNRGTAEASFESGLELPALFRRLHAAGSDATKAENELLARGVSPLELELGKRLTHPDAAVRLRWIEALPGMPQIDARPWLLQLSRDRDAEVRRCALSIMATSGEPQMMRRVREMAREDSDAEVKAQAEQAIKARR